MQSKRNRSIGILLILAVALVVSFMGSSVVEKASASTPLPATASVTSVPATPIPIEIRLERLQSRVDAFDRMVEIQANSFDSTVARLESNLNLLLAFVAIVSVVIGIIGLGFVRIWIRESVDRQLSGVAQAEIEGALGGELERLRAEWEPKFNALYEEYRNLVNRDNEE